MLPLDPHNTHSLLGTRNAPTVEQTRDLTSCTIHLRAESVNEEARTVDAVVATERVVQVFDWRRGEVIDEVLSVGGVDLPERVSLLANHNRYDLDAVHGGVRNFRVQGSDILATLVLDNDERSERAWGKVKRGFINDVSVGYRVDDFVELMPGETKKVSGRSYTAKNRRLRIATKWTIREVSLVPVGADPAAKIREEPGDGFSQHRERNTVMHKRLRAYLQSLGLRSDASEQEALAFRARLQGEQARHAAAVEANPDAYADDGINLRSDATPKPGADAGGDNSNAPPVNGQRSGNQPAPVPAPSQPAPTPSGDEAVRQAERERIRRINELRGPQTPAELITRAVNEGWTPEATSLRILETERGLRSADGGAQPSAPAVHTRQAPTGNDLMRAMAAGLCLGTGIRYDRLRVDVRGEGDERRRAQERLADQGERYSDMSLVDYARAAMQAEGLTVPHNRDELIRAAVSTATLQHIFTDSVNAHVSEGFATAPDSTRSWTEEGDVTDFKLNTDLTLGKTKGMQRLPRGGTAPDVVFDDEAETYRAHRYASKVIIDEQDIIDDNKSLLGDLPREMAEEAAEVRPDLVYSLLLANPTMGDGTALFHADHTNLDTDVLGAAGLTAALVAMAKQKRGDRQLNLRGRHIIVPHDLKFTAMQLINSAEIREAASANGTANVLSSQNLRVEAENRLGVAGVTDPSTKTVYAGSATNWFLAGERRTVKVVYRSGTNRRPQVRRFVLDRGQWGIGFDIVLDIGVFARDHRALWKSTGAGG